MTHADVRMLVNLSRDGDHEAYRQLVRLYQDRLFHAVCAIVACPGDAEDIVQETFVKAYFKLSGFRGDAQIYTWLYRIARNLAFTRQRRRRPSVSLETELPAEDEPQTSPNAVRDEVESAESHDRLQDALSNLPEQYRTPLILREIDGLDYATIADMLNVTVGAVRSRLHRARRELGRVWWHAN